MAETSALISQVNDLGKNISQDGAMDSSTRLALQAAVRKLTLELESDGDKIQRLSYLTLQTSIARTGIDMGVFNMLSNAGEKGMGSADIAKASGADEILVIRILRLLAVLDFIGQRSDGVYYPTSTTQALSRSVMQAGMKHNFDLCGPPIAALPAFLRKNGFQNPTNPADSPFQLGFGTDQLFFPWLMAPENAYRVDIFTQWMIGQREGRGTWLDFFPVEEQLVKGFLDEKDAVFMVDVGGASGSEIIALREKYPNLPGRFILQDLPPAIERIDASKAPFEPTVHNFFTPQPVEGARVYYMRQILHDWPDDKCIDILKPIVAVMKPGYSKLIVNEVVIPDVGATLHQAQLDIIMMVCLAAVERTETMWRKLLEQVGLKITKIWQLDEATENLIEAMLS
ncbi:hypothetical protein MMC25_003083 [Agyrium rufum]|nr:hypothetical protein [Agyrium rufum]